MLEGMPALKKIEVLRKEKENSVWCDF